MSMYKLATTFEILATEPRLKQACEAREAQLGFNIDDIVAQLDRYAGLYPDTEKQAAVSDALYFYMCKHAVALDAEIQPIYNEWLSGFTKAALAAGLDDAAVVKLAQQASYAAPNLIRTPGEMLNDAAGGGVGGFAASTVPYFIPYVGAGYAAADAGANFVNAFSPGQSMGQRLGHVGSGLMNAGMAGLGLVVPGSTGALKAMGKGIGKLFGRGAQSAAAAGGKAVANAGQAGAKAIEGAGQAGSAFTNFAKGNTGWQQSMKGWGHQPIPSMNVPAGANLPFKQINMSGLQQFNSKAPGMLSGAKSMAGRVGASPWTPLTAGAVGSSVMQGAPQSQIDQNQAKLMPGSNTQVVT